MGATQFRLLCTLGLRERDFLLDVGCGSLRAGRLFMSYLTPGRYFGLEPNMWLVREAVQKQVGHDMVALKQPRFDDNPQFETTVFSQKFDFIVAQSIFSHTGPDLIEKALAQFKQSLARDGLVAATFVEGLFDFRGRGWVYPQCVRYRKRTIAQLGRAAGLCVLRIPWYHPRQHWYLLAHHRARLPGRRTVRRLQGVVWGDAQFNDSWRLQPKLWRRVRETIEQLLPPPLRKRLKKTIGPLQALFS